MMQFFVPYFFDDVFVDAGFDFLLLGRKRDDKEVGGGKEKPG
jgi:hypothetical protein